MPPTAVPTSAIAANVNVTSSAAEYARYIRQCLCSLPTPTLLGALKHSEELATILGLTPQLINSHLPCSTATNKGHMRRHRSNTASTSNVHNAIVAARWITCSPIKNYVRNKMSFVLPPLSMQSLGQCTPTSLTPSLPSCLKACSTYLWCMSMTSMRLLSVPCPHAQMMPW